MVVVSIFSCFKFICETKVVACMSDIKAKVFKVFLSVFILKCKKQNEKVEHFKKWIKNISEFWGAILKKKTKKHVI